MKNIHSKPRTYDFDVRRTDQEPINEINHRIEELKAFNKQIENSDFVFQKYNRQIQAKREELNKRREEIEANDKAQLAICGDLVYQTDLLQENLLDLENSDEEELSKFLMSKINFMRDHINDKMNELNSKDLELTIREKRFKEEFENLSTEEKELFKSYGEESLKEINSANNSNQKQRTKNNPNNSNNAINEIPKLNFDNIIQEIRSSLEHLNNRVDNNKLSLQELKPKTKSLPELKQTTKSLITESPVKITEDKEHLRVLTFEGISHIHDTEMLNNKECLLTDGVSLTLSNNLVKLKEVRFREKEPKKMKEISITNHNNSMNELDNSSFRKTDRYLHHNDSSGNFLNSGEVLKGVKTNRTFYLIRQKRMAQMLNSSMDVYMNDRGGSKAEGKLRRNYDGGIGKTNNRVSSLHSSKERSMTLSNTSSDPKLKSRIVSKDKFKETLTIENSSIIYEDEKPKIRDKSGDRYKRIHTGDSMNVISTETLGNFNNIKTDAYVYDKVKVYNPKYAHIQSRYNKSKTASDKTLNKYQQTLQNETKPTRASSTYMKKENEGYQHNYKLQNMNYHNKSSSMERPEKLSRAVINTSSNVLITKESNKLVNITPLRTKDLFTKKIVKKQTETKTDTGLNRSGIKYKK